MFLPGKDNGFDEDRNLNTSAHQHITTLTPYHINLPVFVDQFRFLQGEPVLQVEVHDV